ncbi:MAG: hypothetical protein E5V51_00175 [Mesorhizobium sp.]|nr:hypothetical protein EOA35_01180 [Mesorhizobium sp. M8A.F.Ca.ET.023.01.1.1]TIW90620.1 MAG: hypothetical protein E5V51_00175 [Mesorhizobium sp.]
MAELASLAQKYSEIGKPVGADKDEYFPCLYLDEKQMDAMKLGNPRVGVEMTMTATVRVSSISESQNGARSMSVEITEAAMSPKEKKPDAASVLFPNG